MSSCMKLPCLSLLSVCLSGLSVVILPHTFSLLPKHLGVSVNVDGKLLIVLRHLKFRRIRICEGRVNVYMNGHSLEIAMMFKGLYFAFLG